MIQNAYNGFAKGNFTMLDNLKLGYGGTQEEMKRLLADAEAISGIKYDISSFADVTEAIHVMQESMGIAGTTAREAATTIEGSLSMMKGAWENLVVGMADSNANMDVLINNFVESTATAASNILPRIEQTLVGIGALIEKLAPIIGEALPRLIESVLPSLMI
jgi:phage-related protein